MRPKSSFFCCPGSSLSIINRPGVAGAVLHTASSLIHSVRQCTLWKFLPPGINNIINPKQLELNS